MGTRQEGEEAQNSKEFAEGEFARWCEVNDIEYEEDCMDEDSRKEFVKTKRRFVKAVCEKRLVVNDTSLEYTVSKFSASAGEVLTVSRPTGKSFMAMDGFKETQTQQKANALVASIVGKEQSFVARLDVTDRMFLLGVGTLFLD